MKALTLTQPWATLVVQGSKRQETRQWNTRYRGPLAIHAAKRFPPEAQVLCKADPYFRRALGGADYNTLPLGAVLGVVTLVNCYQVTDRHQTPLDPERSFGDYRLGRWVWVLEHPAQLVVPVPMRGELGLWDLDLDLSTLPVLA